MGKDQETEEKIFEAAIKVFQRDGFAGARMQEIVDEAGINKSMLHYYFRSKDKLFQEVFKLSLGRVVPNLMKLISSEATLYEKTGMVSRYYFETLAENPHLPMFVMYEMHQNPDRFVEFVSVIKPTIPQVFINQVRDAVENEEIIPIEPENFLINLLSWSMFPAIGKNMLKTVFSMDEERYKELLKERVEIIPYLLFNGLLPREGGKQ